MFSQQSLLSFMCFRSFCVAYPLSLAVLKKGISINPPPPLPVMLGQSCHLSADFGFRRHKFLIFFSLLFSFFRDALKSVAGHGKGT